MPLKSPFGIGESDWTWNSAAWPWNWGRSGLKEAPTEEGALIRRLAFVWLNAQNNTKIQINVCFQVPIGLLIAMGFVCVFAFHMIIKSLIHFRFRNSTD